MKQGVLVDTGPLVALLDLADQHHAWARKMFSNILPPLYTCEAVLTEACYLTGRMPTGTDATLKLMERGVVGLAFNLDENLRQVTKLVRRYANVPMSLADACLVRMSELFPESVVLTLDSGFRVFRRNKRERIPLLIPSDR